MMDIGANGGTATANDSTNEAGGDAGGTTNGTTASTAGGATTEGNKGETYQSPKSDLESAGNNGQEGEKTNTWPRY